MEVKASIEEKAVFHSAKREIGCVIASRTSISTYKFKKRWVKIVYII